MRCVQNCVGLVAGEHYSLCFEYSTFSERAEARIMSIQSTALCDFNFDDSDSFRDWYLMKLRLFEKYCRGFQHEEI